MDKELQDLLDKLTELRKGIGQMVFFANIFPNSVIAVRTEIMQYKKKNSDVKEIDLILNSPGGVADDAYRLIRTLRKNFETVNVIIPFWAKSAATLLSLGANTIIMDEFGEFGPLDAQIARAREDGPAYDRESALTDEHSVGIIESRYKIMFEEMFIRLYEHDKINIPKTEVSDQLLGNLTKFFKPLLSQINPYKLGEKKRILDIGAQYAKRILLQFGSPRNEDSARLLVDYLIHECPDHGYVIDKDIMSLFVTNIYDSSKFGDEYKETLQKLSLYLIKLSSEESIIGFMEQDVKSSEEEVKTESGNNAQSVPDMHVNGSNNEDTSKYGEEFDSNTIPPISIN